MNNDANNTLRPFIIAPVTRFLKTCRTETIFDITEVLRYGEDTVIVVGRLVDDDNDATDCFFIAQETSYLALGTLKRAHPWVHERYRRVEVSQLIDFNEVRRDITHVLPKTIRVKRRRFVRSEKYPNYKTGPAPDGYLGFFVHDLKAASVPLKAFSEFRVMYRVNLRTEHLASVIYVPDNATTRKVLQNAAPLQKVGDVHRHSLR